MLESLHSSTFTSSFRVVSRYVLMVASVSSGPRRETKTFASRIAALMGSFRPPTSLLRVVTAGRLVSRFEAAGGFTAGFGRLFLAVCHMGASSSLLPVATGFSAIARVADPLLRGAVADESVLRWRNGSSLRDWVLSLRD